MAQLINDNTFAFLFLFAAGTLIVVLALIYTFKAVAEGGGGLLIVFGAYIILPGIAAGLCYALATVLSPIGWAIFGAVTVLGAWHFLAMR